MLHAVGSSNRRQMIEPTDELDIDETVWRSAEKNRPSPYPSIMDLAQLLVIVLLASGLLITGRLWWDGSRQRVALKAQLKSVEGDLDRMRRRLRSVLAERRALQQPVDEEASTTELLATQQRQIQSAAGERFRRLLNTVDARLAARQQQARVANDQEVVRMCSRKRDAVQTILQALFVNELDRELITAAEQLAREELMSSASRERLIRRRAKQMIDWNTIGAR